MPVDNQNKGPGLNNLKWDKEIIFSPFLITFLDPWLKLDVIF